MQQTDVVRGGDAIQGFAREARKIIQGKGCAIRDGFQRLALDEFHDHVRTAVVHSKIVNTDNVRMLQCGQMRCLRDRAAIGLAFHRARGNDALERDLALQLTIPSAINFAETARGNQSAQLIASRRRRY